MRERDEAAYRILCEAAERGDPCPTNRGIGLSLNMSSGKVGVVLRRLIREGFITIKRPRPTAAARIIKICATGKSTTITNPHFNKTPVAKELPTPAVVIDETNWPDYSKHNIRTGFKWQ